MQQTNEMQDPYKPPTSNVEEFAAASQLPYFKSWLLFVVIAGIGSGLAGAIGGGGIGAIMGSAGASVTTIKIVAGGFGFLLGLPISYYTFKWAVRKFIVASLQKV